MMKEKLLFIASLSTVGSVAQAQSSVTLYGVLDTGIEYVNHVANSTPKLDTSTGTVSQPAGGSRVAMIAPGSLSGPRWGLRGVEDLGAGLQALFVLESGFGVDTGSIQQGGRLFGRQGFVGLSRQGIGTVTFGRQYSTMFDVLANFTPLRYAPLYEPLTQLHGPALRQDNMIKYAVQLGALSAQAHWSFGAGATSYGMTTLANGGAGEAPGAFRDNTAYGAALTYDGGNFGATMIYDQWNPAPLTGSSASVRKATLAGSYAVGPAKFTAGYRWGNGQAANGTTLQRDDMYWVGANYQVSGALTLTLAYYYDNMKALRLVSTAKETNPPNPWQLNFLADYSFSKRTDVYLSMAYSKNSGLNFDTAATGYAGGYALPQGANSQFGFVTGIRHKF